MPTSFPSAHAEHAPSAHVEGGRTPPALPVRSTIRRSIELPFTHRAELWRSGKWLLMLMLALAIVTDYPDATITVAEPARQALRIASHIAFFVLLAVWLPILAAHDLGTSADAAPDGLAARLPAYLMRAVLIAAPAWALYWLVDMTLSRLAADSALGSSSLPPYAILVAALAASLIITWVLLRLQLYLTSAALGHVEFGLADSWRATGGIGHRLIALFLFELALYVIVGMLAGAVYAGAAFLVAAPFQLTSLGYLGIAPVGAAYAIVVMVVAVTASMAAIVYNHLVGRHPSTTAGRAR